MSAWAIQTSFLGDAVLTLPFVHRYLESGASLLLVGAPRNIAIFERARAQGLKKFSTQLDVIAWDKKTTKNPLVLRRFAKSLPSRPERVYCIHRSFSTSLLGLWSGAEKKIGFSSGAATFLYTDLVPRSWDSGRHEIEKNLDLLRLDRECAPWPVDAPSLLGTKNPQKGIVAFSLGSPWATKEWTLENAIELIRKLVGEGVEAWILGDKSFAAKSEEIERRVESKLVKNFTGKTGIQEWIDRIAQASVVVSGDSAAVHVACDLNVPAVALFGPTVTEFGFAPWRRNARVLSLDLDCRPCDIHGPRECPLGHHRCMKDLKADWVYAAIQGFLG